MNLGNPIAWIFFSLIWSLPSIAVLLIVIGAILSFLKVEKSVTFMLTASVVMFFLIGITYMSYIVFIEKYPNSNKIENMIGLIIDWPFFLILYRSE